MQQQRGLPAIANLIASHGRGDDSLLVHMTPDELNSLHGLAQHFGGSLTINPDTGLPEAGWLGKLLPTLLGGALSFIPGVGPLAAAGLVAAGDTAVTGDLKSGLMAGLQAFGGASLGGALGAGNVFGGAAANAGAGGAAGAATTTLPAQGAQIASDLTTPITAENATTALGTAASGAGSGAATMGSTLANPITAANAGGIGLGGTGVAGNVAATGTPLGATMGNAGDIAVTRGAAMSPSALSSLPQATALPQVLPTQTVGAGLPGAAAGPQGFLGKFAAASRVGMPAGMMSNLAPYAAGLGLVTTASGLMQPGTSTPTDDYKYPGNYKSTRQATPASQLGGLAFGSNNLPQQTVAPTAAPAPPTGYGPSGNAPPPPPVVDRLPLNTSEQLYFNNVNAPVAPVSGNVAPYTGAVANPNDPFSNPNNWNFAEGGAVQHYDDGGVTGLAGANPMIQAGMTGKGGTPQSSFSSNGGYNMPSFTGNYTNQQVPGSVVNVPQYSPYDPSQMQQGLPSLGAYGGYGNQGFSPMGYGPQMNYGGGMGGYYGGMGGLGGMGGWQGGAQGRMRDMFRQFMQSQQGSVPSPQQSNTIPGTADTTSAAGDSASASAPQTAAAAAGDSVPQPSNDAFQQYLQQQSLGGYAQGGRVLHMETGGHVLPAFDVATYGNGSSNAGQAKLAKLGGIPIRGSGDGVSDSIPAKIDGKHPARVADGEVYFPPHAVNKLGGNSKLYAMMSAAEKARRATPSGEKVKGLA